MEETCAICLSEMKGKNVAILEDCGHSFCLRCIKQWAIESVTCPLDRSNIKLITSRCSTGELMSCKCPKSFVTDILVTHGRNLMIKEMTRLTKYLSLSIFIQEKFETKVKGIFEELTTLSTDISTDRSKKTIGDYKQWRELLKFGMDNMSDVLKIDEVQTLQTTLVSMRQKLEANSMNKYANISKFHKFQSLLDFCIQILNIVFDLNLCMDKTDEAISLYSQKKITWPRFENFITVCTTTLAEKEKLLITSIRSAKSVLLQLVDLVDRGQYCGIFANFPNRCLVCRICLDRGNSIQCKVCKMGICARCSNTFIVTRESCFFDCHENGAMVIDNSILNADFVCGLDEYKIIYPVMMSEIVTIYQEIILSSLATASENRQTIKKELRASSYDGALQSTTRRITWSTSEHILTCYQKLFKIRMDHDTMRNMTDLYDRLDRQVIDLLELLPDLYLAIDRFLHYHVKYFQCLKASTLPMENTSLDLSVLSSLDKNMVVCLQYVMDKCNLSQLVNFQHYTLATAYTCQRLILQLNEDIFRTRK